MDTSRRAAGLGLLAYGLGTAVAFISIGAPGGDYSESTIVDYLAKGHWAIAMVLAYVGAFATLGLLVFANRMRQELGSAGEVLWGLALAGTAAGVVGWFLVGGISVSFAEGGGLTDLPHSVIYLVSEMSNLIAVCASSFFIGLAIVVLAAKGGLPRGLRIASYIAGGCGVFAPLFFPVFLFWLWAIAVGGWMAATGTRETALAGRAQLA